MEFGYKFENLKSEIAELLIKADALAKSYAEAEDFTKEFLKQCSKHKIKVVSIGRRTNLIEESASWPFDPNTSVFAEGNDSSGWPAIWSVTEATGTSGGCGNHNQHALNKVGQTKLINGVYKFQDGKWMRVE